MHQLSAADCRALIARARIARLACASEGQPYVVPILYACDGAREGDNLVASGSFGRKIEWMRANPRVCVQIDGARREEGWDSVVATGIYEELPAIPAFEAERARAEALLRRRPGPWQPRQVRNLITGGHRPLVPVVFRIRLEEITGCRLPAPDTARRSALRRLWRGLGG